MEYVILSILVVCLILLSTLLFLKFNSRKDLSEVSEKLNNVSKLSEKLNEIEDLVEEKVSSNNKMLSVIDENGSLLRENVILKEKQKEYRQFFGTVLDVLQHDTHFLRSELFRRFGAVPEYSELNTQILSFESKIEATKEALREYRMIEDYDD